MPLLTCRYYDLPSNSLKGNLKHLDETVYPEDYDPLPVCSYAQYLRVKGKYH